MMLVCLLLLALCSCAQKPTPTPNPTLTPVPVPASAYDEFTPEQLQKAHDTAWKYCSEEQPWIKEYYKIDHLELVDDYSDYRYDARFHRGTGQRPEYDLEFLFMNADNEWTMAFCMVKYSSNSDTWSFVDCGY